MVRVAQHADAVVPLERAQDRALGDEVQNVALGAPQRLDGHGQVVQAGVFRRDRQVAVDLTPGLRLGPAVRHAPRGPAAEHDDLQAHLPGAGKRPVEVRADLQLVHVRPGQAQIARQHAVGRLRADGGAAHDLKLLLVLVVAQAAEPRQRHLDIIKAQRGDQIDVFGLGAHAQSDHMLYHLSSFCPYGMRGAAASGRARSRLE